MTFAPPLWKVSVSAPKSEAADIAAVFQLTPPKAQAVLTFEEPFADEALVEALYGCMPDGDLLSRLTGRNVHVALLPDQDWIKLSHQGLPPVRAGRFFVYGAHDGGEIPKGVIPLRIEAGLAFGTGHHETTELCLRAFCDLAKRRRCLNVLDLGCGTGVLAIAAVKLWRGSAVAADIDCVAAEVARANARENGEASRVEVVTADGVVHPRIRARAPFDLIVANILASPLTRLAGQIVGCLAPSGTLILSGLLFWQENLLLGFYGARGLKLRRRMHQGSWSALVLERACSAR